MPAVAVLLDPAGSTRPQGGGDSHKSPIKPAVVHNYTPAKGVLFEHASVHRESQRWMLMLFLAVEGGPPEWRWSIRPVPQKILHGGASSEAPWSIF
ncbi:unnamed protein product [Merluccius merluccius]